MSFIRKIFGSSGQPLSETKGKEASKVNKPGVKGTETKNKVESKVDQLGSDKIGKKSGLSQRIRKFKKDVSSNFSVAFGSTKEAKKEGLQEVKISVVKTGVAAVDIPQVKTDVEKREYLLGVLNDLTGTMLTKMREQEEAKKSNPKAEFPEGLFRVPIASNEKKAFSDDLKGYMPLRSIELLEKYDGGRFNEISNPDVRRNVEIEALGGYLKAYVENMDQNLFAAPEDKAKLKEVLAPLNEVYQIILRNPETRFSSEKNLQLALPNLVDLQKFANS